MTDREVRLQALWEYCQERGPVCNRELDFFRMVFQLDDRFTQKERETLLELILLLRDPTFYWNLNVVARLCPELLKVLKHLEGKLDDALEDSLDPIGCFICSRDDSGSVH